MRESVHCYSNRVSEQKVTVHTHCFTHTVVSTRKVPIIELLKSGSGEIEKLFSVSRSLSMSNRVSEQKVTVHTHCFTHTVVSTRGGNRTRTTLRLSVFETDASTNSATRAGLRM